MPIQQKLPLPVLLFSDFAGKKTKFFQGNFTTTNKVQTNEKEEDGRETEEKLKLLALFLVAFLKHLYSTFLCIRPGTFREGRQHLQRRLKSTYLGVFLNTQLPPTHVLNHLDPPSD